MSWTRWPSELLSVPFRSSREGIGPGEERIATMLGGRVVGHLRSYDVEVPDGTRWEVKMPSNGAIRLEQEGIERARPILDDLSAVVRRLDAVRIRLRDEMTVSDRAIVNGFFDGSRGRSEAADVLRGEVSPARLRFLRQAVEVVRRYVVDPTGTISSLVSPTAVVYRSAADTSVSLSCSQIIGIAEIVGVSPEELSAQVAMCSRVALQYAAVGEHGRVSPLLWRAFADPDAFFRETWSLDPCLVFPNVDGVYLVTEACYRLVERSRFGESFELCRISKGKPYLSA